MYRAVALAASQGNVRWDDANALAELAGRIAITFQQDKVFLEGRDVSAEIRTPAVTGNVRYVANNPGARAHLVAMQRRLACGRDIVTEGRDQGTVAFPEAECKIFLTASPRERARRRALEFASRGVAVTREEVQRDQDVRDREDESRACGALIPAEDAVVVNTDGLDLEQVLDLLERLVRIHRDR